MSVAEARVAALRQDLRTGGGRVRRQALQALRGLGPEAREAIPDVIQVAVGDANGNLRSTASSVLSELDTRGEATQAIAEALGDGDPAVRRRAAELLERLGDRASEAAEPLAHVALEDSDESARDAAAAALGAVDGAGATVPRLVSSLGDPRDSVRLQAAHCLGRVGAARPKESVAALAALLSSASDDLRRAAALGLLGLGELAASAAGALASALEEPSTRLFAAMALARIGPAARQAEPALRRHQGDVEAGETIRQLLTVLDAE